jgi:hypothetical protein
LQIAYSAVDGLYTVTLPHGLEGQLVAKSGNGSFNENGWIKLQSTNSDLTRGKGPETQGRVTLDWPASSQFTYTNFGEWDLGCPMGCNQGVFAYGVPTAASDMPVTGSASYDGVLKGLTDTALGVFGTVFLSLDFAAGTINGHMKPEVAFNGWDATSLGTYTFRDTVYSRGSTSFSGAFNVPGSDAPSLFSGSFTGPNAAELMANWQAPYLRPGTTEAGMMSGVWIAKKGK